MAQEKNPRHCNTFTETTASINNATEIREALKRQNPN